MKAFEGVVRPLGNSLCVLLPKELVREQHIKKGQKVAVSVASRRRVPLDALFGTLKGMTQFEREHD